MLVRKRDKIVVWPVYFDSTKTRSEGRSVPKQLAVSSPKPDELQKAADRLGLQAEIVLDRAYPSEPLRETGFVIVPKEGPKTQLLRRIAEELVDVRGKK